MHRNLRKPFNGKEKDHESGFHYYGARYYWSELLTGWLSVDPMMDKYPGISPYNYCMWNPVKLVDPDGCEAVDDWYKDEKGRLQWNPSVTKETTLKEGHEYLGSTVLLTNDEGQTIYGDEQGKLHTSVPLAEVNITGDVIATEKEANIAGAVSLPVGAFLWEQFYSAAAAAVETAVSIVWLIPACLLVSSDSSPSQNEQVRSKSRNDDAADAKESLYKPFAHDTKKNGK